MTTLGDRTSPPLRWPTPTRESRRRDRGPAPLTLGLVLASLLIGGPLLGARAANDGALSGQTVDALREASTIYQRYGSGDCDAVLRQTSPSALAGWKFQEIRHSTLLLHGFCLERTGQPAHARRIYSDLIHEAPLSFAAADAEERLRALDADAGPVDRERLRRAALERARSGITRRKPLSRAPAAYPPLAKASGVEGSVLVQFGVTRSGETVDPVVIDSQPPLLFDGAVLRAVREWRFKRESRADPDALQLIRIRFKSEPAEPQAEEDASPTESGSEGDSEADSEAE